MEEKRPSCCSYAVSGASLAPPLEELSPLQYFKKFFDEDLVQLITDQTYFYCSQEKVNQQLKTKHIETDKDEIEQFIGQLLMGIFHLPQYRMYWSPSSSVP